MFLNRPEFTVGYQQLTEVQQRCLINVVGTGRTVVQTGDQLSIKQLNDLGMDRLRAARSDATWKSIGSPFNQFQRFRLEVLSDEAQESAMELQLIWWVESKLADGSISMQTGNKYVRRVRQVFDMVNTCYVVSTLDEYQRALNRQGGKAPEHQALPAERGDIESAMGFLAPNEQVGLMTEWKTASRTGEMLFLTRDCLVRTIVETLQGPRIIWIITFPYHKGDPFRLGTAIPVDFGNWEPRIMEHWERLSPGEMWTTLTTERLSAVLGRVREGLTSHSVKRGALVTMLRAGVPLALIQALAKHKDLETLMVYLPRAEVALALRMWEATTPL